MYKREGSMPLRNSCTSNGNYGVSPAESGFNDSLSLLNSEKAVHELIEQPLLNGIDDDLFEFSEALRTVAKALRRVTEGKTSAQAEAAEWKRKYELERAHNLLLEQRVYSSSLLSTRGQCSEFNVQKAGNVLDQIMFDENNEKCELCNGKDDICANEVLRDGESNSDSLVVQTKMMRKA